MGTHMKTTVEIASPLLAQAKRVAARDGTTLRALIEEGLRRVLDEQRSAPSRFVLQDGSVGGEGMDPAIEAGGWPALRALIYEGRGG
jgi:hypothetical protein